MLTRRDAEALERCLAAGGVAVFPADTVYGLACDPEDEAAVERLYALKGRPPAKPAAVMFLAPALARAALPWLGPHTARAVAALVPGAVTLLVPNPEQRFPLACGPVPDVLGVRVPRLPPALAALTAVARPLLQSSANLAGGRDARRLTQVPREIRAGAGLVLDGGELPGTPSTVIDLRAFEQTGEWAVVREGAVGVERVRELLRPPAAE